MELQDVLTAKSIFLRFNQWVEGENRQKHCLKVNRQLKPN